MRPLHALFVVLSLVLVGGVAWRLVESGNQPDGERFAVPTETVAPAATVAPDEVLEKPVERPDDAGRSSLAEAPVSEVQEPVTEARADGPRLTGRVVDSAGAGIAGARIRLVPSLIDGAVILSGHQDEEDYPGRREVETESDGRFEVRGVRSGSNAL